MRHLVAILTVLSLYAAMPATAQGPSDPFHEVAPPPPPAPRPHPTPQPEPDVVTPPPAQPPVRDGEWRVDGLGIPHTACGIWSVRISIINGKPSGGVLVGSGTRVFKTLNLKPDGTLIGETSAGLEPWGPNRFEKEVPIFKLIGKFSNDQLSVMLVAPCGTRQGVGNRLSN